MSGRIDVRRDHPLSGHWRPVDPAAFDVLGLPPAKSRATEITRAQIISETFVVGRANRDAWISYSRRRAFYADRSRYWPANYTFDRIVPSVDHLVNWGLLEHEKAAPGDLGWQSRFRATDSLMSALADKAIAILHQPTELVRLRDFDGNLVDYEDNRRTRSWRRQIAQFNEALSKTEIGLGQRIIASGDPLWVEPVTFRVVSSNLYRVFNRGSFQLGGRLYGGWWQNIPKPFRPDITINGCHTIELDYPRLHPTLIYNEAGHRISGDAYDISGWPRPLVKRAFNTLINADTRLAAVKSVANDIRGSGAYAHAELLVEQIEAKHRLIASAFGTGAGLRLMRKDSDMATYILSRLLTHGVVALPVHDSFVVADRTYEKCLLLDCMAEALHNACEKNAVKSASSSKIIPQYGAGAAGEEWVDLVPHPLPCVYIFFPDLPQSDFFGGDRAAIPARDLLDWHGGHLSPGLKDALRHEARRRHLRQLDLASILKLSRSQLSNLLAGRSGAGVTAADRIREFLISGAKTVGGPP